MTSPHADPQARAANPHLSAFVTANAGSGKTKTLIDRVARLLLAGAEPQTILCVTYTKAAAAEMQRRLFALLGDWSIWADTRLRLALSALEGRPLEVYDESRLSEARALFARALETPGGLKIQTIHAFCEKLLRRFPLEAGLSPGFKVLEDSETAHIEQAARREVALRAQGPGPLGEAYARLAVALDFQRFQDMFKAFDTRRGDLERHFEATGGLAGALAELWDTCCQSPVPLTLDDIEAELRKSIDPAVWIRARDVLRTGNLTDQGRAEAITAFLKAPDLAQALDILFTGKGEGTPAAWTTGAKVIKTRPELRDALVNEQVMIEDLRERRRAVSIALDTQDALVLAMAYLAAFKAEKAMAQGLDFADLIERTVALTAKSPQAAWVLYKLDGGISHILVDEAQDTSPDQWEIVRALSAEFFSGAGLPTTNSSLTRNMFVVGDEKQSIYSFQGAAPENLMAEFAYHRSRAEGAGQEFERIDLLTSFRSSRQILEFVDAAFAPPARAGALVPRKAEDQEVIRHEAKRTDPGCIDLWPLVREEKKEKTEAWDPPENAESNPSADRRLAEQISAEIQAIVARKDAVGDRETRQPRAANYGDILILVRRRGTLFNEILRALKRQGIPVAGADRLALSQHILFDDLVALARFVLFPGDDLTLAALLRSPFCDLSDDSLYDLAHGRDRTLSLWTHLEARAGDRKDWAAAMAFLSQALADARQKRPFEFYAGLLAWRDDQTRTQTARILTRLGEEAQEALDEFMNQVLVAEQQGIHDLECLTDSLSRLDIVVKREMDAERDEVRVMTAHGAKGLESSIVFLPETTLNRVAAGTPLLMTASGGFLWASTKTRDCTASSEARALRVTREANEALRLLYVALTRARDRIILCGKISATTAEDADGTWWSVLKEAFASEALAHDVKTRDMSGITFQRYGMDPEAAPSASMNAMVPGLTPAWVDLPAKPEAFASYASPSDLGEDTSLPSASPLVRQGGLGRFRRGELIHRLLQVLPDLPREAWPSSAFRILSREPDLSEAQREDMTQSALGVLADPQFSEIFGSGSRAEVSLAGTASQLPASLAISGRLDRLVVRADKVLFADFKTNRPSPDRIESADPAYLRQMSLYWAVLSDIFPDRPVSGALIWTDGPKLMAIPEDLMRETLRQIRQGG